MKWRRALAVAALALAASSPPALAGNLTFPVSDPHPRITAWMDHHYPTRQEDGIMIRYDGATSFPYDGHRGTDYAVPANTPVVAADEGIVIYAEWSDTGGWGVVIDHAVNRTAYFHNNTLYVYAGQQVARGQLISLSGSTGNSTGPHLHFEVRDLLWPWHSVDPYGWTGPGPDPWHWDMGYLWTSDPPTPFLLPLAFLGGARWSYWYGLDGAPPPVTWSIRDGTRGFAGYAAQWDGDPGPAAVRSGARQGSISLPGPGAHTLHLRVFDATGASADITYLYLYDRGRPTGQLKPAVPRSTALAVDWTAQDDLSGVQQVAIEVARSGGAFKPWALKTLEGATGAVRGAVRFFGEPGTDYQFRLTARNQARNASEAVVESVTLAPAAGRPPTLADREILGTLPDLPPGLAEPLGLRQEHPVRGGAMLLSADGELHSLGASRTAPAPGAAGAPAVDMLMDESGAVLLLADGTTTAPGPAPRPLRPGGSPPVRLLRTPDGSLLVIGAKAPTMADRPLALSPALGEDLTLLDGGMFSSGKGGLVLDRNGVLHAFGDAAAALVFAPTAWTLSNPPAGMALTGSVRAPAGLLLDAAGGRQVFGSLLLLPDGLFAGPTFDPMTGLAVR